MPQFAVYLNVVAQMPMSILHLQKLGHAWHWPFLTIRVCGRRRHQRAHFWISFQRTVTGSPLMMESLTHVQHVEQQCLGLENFSLPQQAGFCA